MPPEEAQPLAGELTGLFLAREAAGAEYRNDVQFSTQHGSLFESRFDLFQWPEPPVRRLAQFCHDNLKATLQRLSDYSDEELGRLAFHYHSWFHITRQGGYQGLHNHQNASWSGIYCVDPGDEMPERPDSGMVRFHDPRGQADMYSDAGNQRLKIPANHGVLQIRHEPGKLLIFPSYLLHEIFPYAGQRPRIVVAFNCWIKLRHAGKPPREEATVL